MKVILFGATGMVGQGVLRECLHNDKVDIVQTIGRMKTGVQHVKIREVEKKDLFEFTSIEDKLSGFDACFFCLGVTSAGLKEADYRRITFDITLAAAKTLAKLNPNMVFVYVSGRGTDSTEHGRIMWARVKGETENALLRLPFKAAYMFRPGAIQPLHGATSKTKLYRIFYSLSAPIFPLLKILVPNAVTTTEQMGKAMIHVVEHGFGKSIVESPDINQLK